MANSISSYFYGLYPRNNFQNLSLNVPSRFQVLTTGVFLASHGIYNYIYRSKSPWQDPPPSKALILANTITYGFAKCSPAVSILGSLFTYYVVNKASSFVMSAIAPKVTDRFYVKTDVANIYTKPDSRSALETQAIYGEKLIYVRTVGNYIEVELAGGNRGFIRAKEIGLDQRVTASKDPSKFVVRKNIADFYYGPDTECKIGTYVFGTILYLAPHAQYNEGERWVEVIRNNGEQVWMQVDDIRRERVLSLEEIVAISEQFLGIHYVWGGASSKGFDCSGFIKNLFARMGISLPHSAHQISQLDIFEEISDKQQLKRKDLILFKSSNLKSKRFTHIGMMLNESDFIHCTVPNPEHSISGGVQISSIRPTNSIWGKRFGGGRRLKI